MVRQCLYRTARQAEAGRRAGLLSREQLDYLLDRVAEGEAHAGPVQPENGSVQVQCYGCSYTGNIQTVSFRMYTVNAYKVTESGEMYSIDDETSIELMYLPGNGAFLQVGVLDNRLPRQRVHRRSRCRRF